MAKTTKQPKEMPKKKTHNTKLTLWERIELSSNVLSQGKGVREMLRAQVLRHQLYPTAAERKKYEMEQIAPGVWQWLILKDSEIKSDTTLKEIKFFDADLDYIKDCIKLLLANKKVDSSLHWVQLMYKFFTLEEMDALADELDPIKKKSE